MIADTEDGKIDTVITKDLSRLGRNYLESGAYIEVFFPQHHVRYIAVNDGVDSEQSGKHIRALEGYGTNRISKVLYKRRVMRPGYYKQEFFSQHDTGSDDYWYDWQADSITRILRNPIYKGGMYVHTTSKPTFRCKGSGYIRWADRDVLEDVHEAIVTKEVWQTANDIIDRHTKVKLSSSGYENIFRGLLKCADCGQTLLVHTDGRNPDRKVIDRTCYECTTYRKKMSPEGAISNKRDGCTKYSGWCSRLFL